MERRASKTEPPLSYAAISTRNTIGSKPLPPATLSGWARLAGHNQLLTLGDLDMNDQAVIDALNAGIDQGTLATLVAEGATDGQLEALANGQLDLPTLMAMLTGNLPAPGSAAGTATNFPSTSGLTSAQQAQVNQAIQQTGMDPTDDASWYDITGQLQAMNSNIQTLEAMAQKYPAVASAAASQIIALRQEYSGIASQWVGAYSAVYGSTPSGLSGLGTLGIAPLVAVAYIAVFVAVVAGLYALVQHYNAANATAQAAVGNAAAAQTQAQANITATANQTALTQQIAAANASGNTALASTLAKQLQSLQATALTAPPPAATTLTEWFETNWMWVAGAAAVFVLAPPLIKKI